MSFDDYATHIYKKLRLAVALAIIRSKPTNKPTDEYLKELKSKMDDKMEDDDVTVCSDDFLMDDDDLNDSVNILKDFDLKDIHKDTNFQETIVYKDQGKGIADSAQPINLQDNLTQMTIFENSQFVTQNSVNLQSDKTIYNEHVDENSKNLSKGARNVVSDRKNQESENAVHDSYHDSTTNESNTAKIDLTYYDSQKTVLYTVHGFTQNYTHYSPSQTDIIIPQKYIYGIKEKEKSNVINTDPNVVDDYNKTNMNDNTAENPNIITDIEFGQNTDVFSQIIDDNSNRLQENNIQSDTINSVTESSITSKNNETPFQPQVNIQNVVQYSQNANEFFEEMENINKNISNDYQINKKIPQCISMENNDETLIFSQNNDLYTVFSQNIQHSTNNHLEAAINSQSIYTHSVNGKNQINNENRSLYNLDTKTINSNQNPYHENQESETATHDSYHNLITLESNTANTAKIYSFDSQKPIQSTILCDIDENNDIEDYGSREIVSYKVLEEFNKVKTYLRRNRRMSCDGYSTDSGYRSDSQLRSSNRSALQLTDNWLNESACCLFNYIMQCPLVAATRDITNEIAQVLSQLIDKLHEEEKYPSFLEDLLDTVDVLLRRIYEGTSSENEFLTTDENMQRILLLNKSIHIQQHSIEKISNILEIFHTKVTEKDTTYELTNIDEIENVSYMFHILEILLKKYLLNKDKFSQSSTQMSQDEDKILRKSSISDIWRKKWNPSQKVFEGSKEKKCVLKVCSNVLNKIVVDCVSSYSLVAYSALKCFNSMQS